MADYRISHEERLPQRIGTPTITGLVDTQEKIIMETLAVLDQLEGRLSPILRDPNGETNIAETPREILVPLAAKLRDNNTGMAAILTRVNSLLSRLEL